MKLAKNVKINYVKIISKTQITFTIYRHMFWNTKKKYVIALKSLPKGLDDKISKLMTIKIKAS